MPSIPNNQLFPRDDDMPALSNIYIVGIVVVCVLVGGVATFLLIHWIRKRAAKKKFKETMGTTRNISLKMRDNSDARSGTSSGSASFQEKDSTFQPPTKLRPKSSVSSPSPLRNAVVPPTIVIPEPALTAPRAGAASRNEIISFHRQSGTMPKPFSFALARGGPVSPIDPSAPSSPSDKDSRPSSWIRHSFLSANSGKSGGNRYSVMSMRSTTSSFGAEPTTGTTRKVRQIFNPVLPDELLLTKVGEQLTVLQTFDDGWCVAGRENSSTFQQKKSLFKNATPGSPEDNNLELGVVPAWCFLKPVQGLRAERPMRNTSLGITVQIEAPGHSSRNDIVSWCNF